MKNNYSRFPFGDLTATLTDEGFNREDRLIIAVDEVDSFFRSPASIFDARIIVRKTISRLSRLMQTFPYTYCFIAGTMSHHLTQIYQLNNTYRVEISLEPLSADEEASILYSFPHMQMWRKFPELNKLRQALGGAPRLFQYLLQTLRRRVPNSTAKTVY